MRIDDLFGLHRRPRQARAIEVRADRTEGKGRPDLAALLRREARLMDDPLSREGFGFTSQYARGAVLQTTGIGFTVGGILGTVAGSSGGAAFAVLAAVGGGVTGAALGVPVALALAAILRQRVRDRLEGVEALTPADRARALEQEMTSPGPVDRATGALVGGITGVAEGFLGGSSFAWDFSFDQRGSGVKALLSWSALSPTLTVFGLPLGAAIGGNRGAHEGTRSRLGFAGGMLAAGAVSGLLCPWLTVPAALLGGVLAGALLDPVPSQDGLRLRRLVGSDMPVRHTPELLDIGIRLVTGLDMTPADAVLIDSLLDRLSLEERLRLMRDLDTQLQSKALTAEEIGPHLRSRLPNLLGLSAPPANTPLVEDRGERVQLGPISLKKRAVPSA